MKLFITYAREDYEYAKDLKSYLRESGDEEVFLDETIREGEYFLSVITNQLIEADILLFLVSNHSINSKHCKQEFKTFTKYHQIIIPIYINLDFELQHNDLIDKLKEYPPLPYKSNNRELKPINQWSNRENAFKHIVKRILERIESAREELENKKAKNRKHDDDLSENTKKPDKSLAKKSKQSSKKKKKVDHTFLYPKVLAQYLAVFDLKFSDLKEEVRMKRKLFHFYEPQRIAFEPFSNAYGNLSVVRRRIESELSFFKKTNFRTYLVAYDLFEEMSPIDISDETKIKKQKAVIAKKLNIIDKVIRSYNLGGRLHVARLEIIDFNELLSN